MQLDGIFAGVDARDTQRFAEDAQAVAVDQRAGGVRQRTETVDQFFLQQLQLVIVVAVGEALVEHQPLVYVVTVVAGQQCRRVQIDLGGHAQRRVEVGFLAGFQ